jgi:hypothetical protein
VLYWNNTTGWLLLNLFLFVSSKAYNLASIFIFQSTGSIILSWKAYYFSEHICILFNITWHFSEHSVLRSEAALYFNENVCVSVNKIHYFCQHLLFHPDKTSYFRKKFVVSIWHCVLFQRTPVLLHLIWLFTLTYTLAFHPDMAYYSSEYLLRSVRHAFLFQETFSHVLIIKANEMHYSSTLFW